ncbi:c4-dicarboxylate transporter [Purpureocillium lavendulum]|uniref:C4-dicarboxylate transporter n=1 Tax=Purpureocillium lavendulum TaxID=1247861 RepID=A0AB34FSY2_9HYPO|nr:c4-dicarboxylate transporter [Purpureocillium lavendulum]
MPLANFGSLVLTHVVFLTHLVYINLAFSHAEPSLLVVLYFVSKLGSRAASAHGCGYESPNEENQPPFFTGPSPAPSVRQATARHPASTRPGAGVHGPVSRPAFVSRPSYAAAAAPDGHARHNRTEGWRTSPSAQASLNGMVAPGAEKMLPGGKVTLKDRIACYQWTYFTMTMATGGIANVMHSLPYRPAWVTGIGVFFFLLNVALFLLHCVLIAARFRLRPGSFVSSFTDQVESLFIPAFVVSIAIILINTCEYGVPRTGVWLLRTMEVLFWFYVALSVFASAGLYLVLWSTLIFPVHTMTPTWVFPAYPLLLTAPFAATLIDSAETSSHTLSLNATAVALGAATTQGTGCLIAFMISAAFLYRLMTQKLPRDTQRPGVFMSIGPFGFTAAGIAQLGNQAKQIFPPDFLGSEITVDIIRIVSLLVGLWLWGLAMWFFLVSVGSLWKYARSGSSLPFQMTWWSFVFPNTALVTATQVMGKIFQSKGLRLFGSIMTIVLIVVWVGVFVTMMRCLRTRKLLWPKDNT